MCFPFPLCTVLIGSTHLSASWINYLTGVQVLPAKSNVGLILDPKAIRVQCLYPTDAVSNERQDFGCGPFEWDPEFPGYTPAEQQVLQQEIRHYKTVNFGVNTTASEIDCMDFITAVPRHPSSKNMYDDGAMSQGQSALTWRWKTKTLSKTIWNGMTNGTDIARLIKQENRAAGSLPHTMNRIAAMTQEIDIQSPYALFRDQYEGVLSKGWDKVDSSSCNRGSMDASSSCVCTISDDELNRRRGDFWLYSGSFSWSPEQWQNAMNTQLQFLNEERRNKEQHHQNRNERADRKRNPKTQYKEPQTHYTVDYYWNEIILALPESQLQDSVLAVFYLVDKHNGTCSPKRTPNTGAMANDPACEGRRQLAHRQARILGNKPVLRLHQAQDHPSDPLLSCDEGGIW